MAKKRKKLKVYRGTASDGVVIFITAEKKKYAQTDSHTPVERMKFIRPGRASTVQGLFDNLMDEAKPKKVPHERSVNLG